MQKNNKKNSQKYNRPGQQEESFRLPPSINQEPILHKRYRHQADAAVTNVTISARDLSHSIGVIATAATTACHLSYAIRLRRLRVWAWPVTVGTPAIATIDWNSNSATGGIYGPGSQKTATTVSLDRPAYLNCRPPKDSLADMWHRPDDTTVLLNLTLPAGALIDAEIDAVLNDSEVPIASASVTGATVGQIYHKKMDPNLTIVGNLNSIA